ncbi:acetyltransferase [Alloalcanivorax xenomutans]|uniref:acetyltransferase n=1 Tax=Alloalcanivorax xenomutans TaxID=1094342 RepID=UPI003BA9637C
MKPVVIVGYGGFGREVFWLAKDCGREVLGFLDDGTEPGTYGRYQVLGPVKDWPTYFEAEFVVAIGNPRTRKKVVMAMQSSGVPQFATLIHPSVVMDSESVEIGEGTLICAGCVGTVDFKLGKHVIVNIKCTVAHDDLIGDFVTVAPLTAISGNVTLQDGVEVGTGAALRQGVTMATGSMLGMGGTLTKDAEANTIYVGSPAKPFKELPSF